MLINGIKVLLITRAKIEDDIPDALTHLSTVILHPHVAPYWPTWRCYLFPHRTQTYFIHALVIWRSVFSLFRDFPSICNSDLV